MMFEPIGIGVAPGRADGCRADFSEKTHEPPGNGHLLLLRRRQSVRRTPETWCCRMPNCSPSPALWVRLARARRIQRLVSNHIVGE